MKTFTKFSARYAFVCGKETAVIGGIGKLYSYVTEDTLHLHYKTPTAPAVLRTNR